VGNTTVLTRNEEAQLGAIIHLGSAVKRAQKQLQAEDGTEPSLDEVGISCSSHPKCLSLLVKPADSYESVSEPLVTEIFVVSSPAACKSAGRTASEAAVGSHGATARAECSAGEDAADAVQRAAGRLCGATVFRQV
jgi:hypothetical protein